MALEVVLGNQRQEGQGGAYRSHRMLVDRQGRVERGDQCIADMVHDHAASLIDDLRRRAKKAVE